MSQTKDYIFERIYRGWDVPAALFSPDGDELRRVPDDSPAEMFPGGYIAERIRNSTGLGLPEITVEEEQIFHIAFPDPEGNLVLIGPGAFEPPTFTQLLHYRRGHHILGKNYQIAHVPLSRAVSLAVISYFMMTGRACTENEVQTSNVSVREMTDTDHMVYEMHHQTEYEAHLSYQEELKFLHQIETGTLESGDHELTPENRLKMKQIGQLSCSDSLKQTEYMVLTSNVLASRAAIRGGVSPHIIYPLSDKFDQEISRCRNSMDLLNIHMQIIRTYSDEVRKARSNISDSDIEEVKNYIAKNRAHKITLADLADVCGLAPSYLSRKFANQEGITIKSYIIKVRLEAAANMLRYSDESISDIAEYLQFSSQSYFGSLFRREYGITPNAFRMKYQVRDINT